MAETLDFSNHPLHPGSGVPLFIAAGVLKTPADLAPFLQIEDPRVIPTLSIGAFTLMEFAGNAATHGGEDFVYRSETGEAGNCRGLPNGGKEAIRRLKPIIRELSDKGVRTILQVTNLPSERPAEVIPELIEIAAEVNPTAIEVNLSCPNGRKADGSFEAPTSDNPEASAEVMSLSRARVGDEVTLGAKDSPHATSPYESVKHRAVRDLVLALNPYIDFLTGINTIGNQNFPELTAGNGRGGMSGPIVASIAKDWLVSARSILNPETPILSCGGIDSHNLPRELRVRTGLGAMLVGGAQEFYRKDPVRLNADWVQRTL